MGLKLGEGLVTEGTCPVHSGGMFPGNLIAPAARRVSNDLMIHTEDNPRGREVTPHMLNHEKAFPCMAGYFVG
jgi:hypothetical protein